MVWLNFSKQSSLNVLSILRRKRVYVILSKIHMLTPDSNLTGYLNILEGCRHNKVQHLLYASSSSVYGLNRKMPFSTDDSVDHPVSLYAATKKANELMAHTYSHLYSIPTTGTALLYGSMVPGAVRNMALFKFTKAMLEGKSIDVYNYGKMKRDFTYIG
ncbi:Uridine diphosphate galacturonate 4-epimerase [Klebsiella pneumoniae]|uniref:Uridine diphosphate galacturonate 4-epimerase n=1 Tax=Klebsiella pneumoniae TaxID=573 RepID=A0A2X3H807_KLEPN|nr:Uridine diphosphate galacturonate 4-epimerase [Klebsiella pneumoniae]